MKWFAVLSKVTVFAPDGNTRNRYKIVVNLNKVIAWGYGAGPITTGAMLYPNEIDIMTLPSCPPGCVNLTVADEQDN